MESLLNVLSIALSFIAVLTVVVFIHEMGHFLVARWCGVTIQAFSIGFGREIFGFYDRHGTRWKFCWLPLGGYVRFIDDEFAASTSSEASLEKLSIEQREGAFQSQPLLNRALVVAAGPLFNIASAIIIYIMMFWLIGTSSIPAVVGKVLPGSAAATAGLKPGDRITAIDTATIETFSDLQRIVSQSAGHELAFVIDRNGKSIELPIKPDLREITDQLGNKLQVGLIGVQPSVDASQVTHQSYSLPSATAKAFSETGFVSWQIIKSIPKLPGAILKTLTGHRQSEIGGPIALAEMTAHASKVGVSAMLGWLAVFSIMLGIMNLLPIPILDGGHLMFYAFEAIRGRPLDPRKQELGFRIGMAILATMMFAALFGDIMRKLGIG